MKGASCVASTDNTYYHDPTTNADEVAGWPSVPEGALMIDR